MLRIDLAYVQNITDRRIRHNRLQPCSDEISVLGSTRIVGGALLMFTGDYVNNNKYNNVL